MNITDRIVNARQHTRASFTQAENASLPYTINYSHIAPDTISTSTWNGNGATVTNTSKTDNTTSATLSGLPGKYQVINKIVTAAGITDERIISLTIQRDNTSPVQGDYQ